ncbi:Hcp family type VI secretion system effector [Chitinimonas koreensis]|uniref:Hcp family type VI secretion system effector n=1 Tax=Chitinimonas koreensis TaxID=356302 RepID=UPI0003F5A618|nr:type VI secretion system tube protein Hcp [Chitinimonas koreensis]QNM95349.1 type VI secretion system tube protein Hcp [Chitinimonas koreensis]
MDLILLQPGDATLFTGPGGGGANGWATGGSLVNTTDWGSGGDPTVQNFDGTPAIPFSGNAFIELVSIHQGIKQQMTTDVSNSARTSGRPIITEFTCVKYVDKLSVKFFDLCLRAKPLGAGKTQPTMIYIMRNSGDKTANILTMALRDAMISEIQFQSNPDDMPTEQFKLNFTEILWKYTVQLADTKTAGVVPAGWSIARNRPIGDFTD